MSRYVISRREYLTGG
jgi:tetratricopeptide (TPR) repeat protein